MKPQGSVDFLFIVLLMLELKKYFKYNIEQQKTTNLT